MRVLAGTLAILLLGDQLLFLFARETLEQFAGRLLPTWLPLRVFGPFLAYEIVALVVLRYRRARGKSIPTAARFANAVIEISLPTVILWWMNQFTNPLVAFGAWPTLLYFVFIVASTLRLDFVLPAFTGAVAAISYLGMACWVLSFGAVVANPISHVSKAAMMVVAGVVAARQCGCAKFRYAFEQAATRDASPTSSASTFRRRSSSPACESGGLHW
jgi:adenylate cyclase